MGYFTMFMQLKHRPIVDRPVSNQRIRKRKIHSLAQCSVSNVQHTHIVFIWHLIGPNTEMGFAAPVGDR